MKYDLGKPEPFPYEQAVEAAANAHECCRLLPVASKDSIRLLAQSIKELGQQNPVAYWRESVGEEIFLVDGRHRIYLMKGMGLKWDSVIYTCKESAIIAWILAENIARRQLTKDERELVAAQFAKRLTLEQEAEVRGESIHKIRRERGIRKKAVPEIESLYDQKRLTLHEAYRVAVTLTEAAQSELAAALNQGVGKRPALIYAFSQEGNRVRGARIPPDWKERRISVSIQIELTQSEAADRYNLSSKSRPTDHLLIEATTIAEKLKRSGLRTGVYVVSSRDL
jgi:ParB-like chromosome segregation protein Spo0J